MTIYLPKPYPDELLYSVIARYGAYAGIKHIAILNKKLLGGRSRLNPFLPRGLSTVSERTWPIWHMSGREIALKLTMFPYYEAFSPSSRKEQIISDLLGGTSLLVQFLIQNRGVKTLRYCRKCSNEDIMKYGETYWKRSHQMKGVAVCPDHGAELIEVVYQHGASTGVDLIDATEATSNTPQHILCLNKGEKQQLIAIARRCRSMLNGELEPEWKNACASLYLKVAVEKGLCSERVGCRNQIVEKFKEVYNGKVIHTFNLRECKNTTGWVEEMFFTTQKREFQPIAHAVIQEFLLATPTASVNQIQFGLGPWKCPNPLGQHNTSFPIKKVVTEWDRDQRAFARTTCCCGYGFTFYTTSSNDPAMPVVHKVTEYGPSWKDSAKFKGLSDRHVAQKSTEEGKYSNNKSNLENYINLLRRKLIDVLNATEHHTLREAYLSSPGLYRKLQQIDPNFLWCQISRIHTGTQKDMKLRSKEDAIWSVRFRAAAVAILNQEPPTLVSKKAILIRSGFTGWLNRSFPKSKNVLEEMHETSKAFRMRRLNYLAAHAISTRDNSAKNIF